MVTGRIPTSRVDQVHARPLAVVRGRAREDLSGLASRQLFGWEALASWKGWLPLGVGGFLVGFGSRWAGGCTSGHAITGLATFQLPSLLAVLGFFAGGLLMTHVILPGLL